tara:strand:+ start:2111 stop:2539 length:429 start_codon:yes stop_codon:yes gene_type:complete
MISNFTGKQLIFNYLIIFLVFAYGHGDTLDTIEFIQNNQIIATIDIPRISYDQMLKHIFRIIDMNSNDYLDYGEMSAFQKATHPHIDLTKSIFKQICYHMGVNPYVGLTRMDLNRSYSIYKDELGTDIEHDYTIIKRMQYIM